MASVSNFAQYGSHLTNLVLGQEKRNYQLIKEDRDHRMAQKLKAEEIKAGNINKLLGPLAGVVGAAAGSGLMNQLGSLFGPPKSIQDFKSQAAGHFEGMGTGAELQGNILDTLYPNY